MLALILEISVSLLYTTYMSKGKVNMPTKIITSTEYQTNTHRVSNAGLESITYLHCRYIESIYKGFLVIPGLSNKSIIIEKRNNFSFKISAPLDYWNKIIELTDFISELDNAYKEANNTKSSWYQDSKTLTITASKPAPKTRSTSRTSTTRKKTSTTRAKAKT